MEKPPQRVIERRGYSAIRSRVSYVIDRGERKNIYVIYMQKGHPSGAGGSVVVTEEEENPRIIVG